MTYVYCFVAGSKDRESYYIPRADWFPMARASDGGGPIRAGHAGEAGRRWVREESVGDHG